MVSNVPVLDTSYYDGTKLLSTKDINGNTPEIFMCTTNRTGGKTTYFARLLVNGYLKKNKKFCLLYRYNYELDDCANSFFKDINSLFFREHEMTSKPYAKGIFHSLFLDGNNCGYAIAMNNADAIKKLSHLFSDTSQMFLDEFQSETDHYCTNEIEKFRSIHTSIARGQGKQYRYVPVYMCSNPITLLNPYYTAMGISERLRNDTHFLRGTGFVLEQGYNDSARNAQEQGAFNQAFGLDRYNAYMREGVYLNDNYAFIEKMGGRSKYLVTIRYEGKEYGVREFSDYGIIYCDNRPDTTFPYRISSTLDDHQINYVMLKQNDDFLTSMKYFFRKGCFRFRNLQCKEAIIKTLSY